MVGFGEVVEPDGLQRPLGDAFGAVADRGDRGLADQSGKAPDLPCGPVVEVGGLAGQGAGPVRAQIECCLDPGDQFTERLAFPK
ncbi:hypothetical protein KBZ21_11655 [Streptomyces sp. A73]|nr:hypothetical protein [Streptomyces sp. A73]